MRTYAATDPEIPIHRREIHVRKARKTVAKSLCRILAHSTLQSSLSHDEVQARGCRDLKVGYLYGSGIMVLYVVVGAPLRHLAVAVISE